MSGANLTPASVFGPDDLVQSGQHHADVLLFPVGPRMNLLNYQVEILYTVQNTARKIQRCKPNQSTCVP